MKIQANFKYTANKEAKAIIDKAIESGLKDTVVLISNQVVDKTPWLTGNNSRSIKYEPKNRFSWEVYSTSGYGGWLEVGSTRMKPRPYFLPALDRYLPELPNRIKGYM